MTPKDIIQLLDAHCICGKEHLQRNVRNAFAADLMSDVLRVDTSEMLLITGMANLQVIRTAEMSDIPFILFVRGKMVTPEMEALARENDMVVLTCPQSMFKVCGELYKAGLQPIY